MTHDTWHVGGAEPSHKISALTVWKWRFVEDIITSGHWLTTGGIIYQMFSFLARTVYIWECFAHIWPLSFGRGVPSCEGPGFQRSRSGKLPRKILKSPLKQPRETERVIVCCCMPTKTLMVPNCFGHLLHQGGCWLFPAQFRVPGNKGSSNEGRESWKKGWEFYHTFVMTKLHKDCQTIKNTVLLVRQPWQIYI